MAQPPSRKPSRQLDPADLPDPLGDSQDVPMASAEDLLSEIAGDDVERLMSGEYEPVTGEKAVQQLQHQLGNFLDELRQRERPGPSPAHVPAPQLAPRTTVPRTHGTPAARRPQAQPPRPTPPAAPTPPALPARASVQEEDVTTPLDDLVGPTNEQLVGLHSGEFEPTVGSARGPAESRALLAPVDEVAIDPVYLRPLDWLSAPIAAMSSGGRVAVSVLSVFSFFGGCAALGYVLILRYGGV